MIRLSRYSRGRTDYHSPPGSPWEIPRREGRRERDGSSRASARSLAQSALVISGFLIVVRIRCAHECTFALVLDGQSDELGLGHVQTILHFFATAHATRSRPPIWPRMGYDLIFRVPQRNLSCPPFHVCPRRFFRRFRGGL